MGNTFPPKFWVNIENMLPSNLASDSLTINNQSKTKQLFQNNAQKYNLVNIE